MTDQRTILPPPEIPPEEPLAEESAPQSAEPPFAGRRLRAGDSSKRILLSLMLTGASIAYVFDQALRRNAADAAVSVADTRAPAPLFLPTTPAEVASIATDPPAAKADTQTATAADPAPANAPPPTETKPPLPASVRAFLDTLPPAATTPAAAPPPAPGPSPAAADRTAAARQVPDGGASGLPARAPLPAPFPRTNPQREAPRVTTAQVVPELGAAGLARPKLRDGVYRGPSVNAYYGVVQVEVTVANGKVAEVMAVDYPADRGRSQRINSQALPMLRTEVIRGQSADVDIISGATLTSVAYARSLALALAQSHL